MDDDAYSCNRAVVGGDERGDELHEITWWSVHGTSQKSGGWWGRCLVVGGGCFTLSVHLTLNTSTPPGTWATTRV